MESLCKSVQLLYVGVPQGSVLWHTLPAMQCDYILGNFVCNFAVNDDYTIFYSKCGHASDLTFEAESDLRNTMS